MMFPSSNFSHKQGPSLLSPEYLAGLGRPSVGIANDVGDLVLVPHSRFSVQDNSTVNAIFIASLETKGVTQQTALEKLGEVFWLDSRTIAHIVEGDNGVLDLYTIPLKLELGALSTEDTVLIGSFPTSSAANFAYSASANRLVFSDSVYPDGDLTKVKETDKAWDNRGNTALVYEASFERHWNHWIGPKRTSLFTVKLEKSSDKKWTLGNEWTNLLKGNNHPNSFGGRSDFDISSSTVVFTAKDPNLPPAWHTRQNIYIVDIDGSGERKELTSGEQGMTEAPVFSKKQDKVAWLEQDIDGYESDKRKVVIYDLVKDIRYTLTQEWDRSPSTVVFSEDDSFLYLLAGDHAKYKIFTLPVLPTPSVSTTNSVLGLHYKRPVAVTKSGSALGLQTLPGNRIVFTRSSFTSPNNVFTIRNLRTLQDKVIQTVDGAQLTFTGEVEQITYFGAEELQDKALDAGEEFWFEGAHGKQVHGWIFKPPGFKHGEKKKWPALLMIHGVFAHQGYIVIGINPTGSTTFGEEFSNAISEDWGGKIFEDLSKGWKYVLEKYPEIDPERAVANGASWAGYAINWIQGHPELGFNFKAVVNYAGIFDPVMNAYGTDEMYFATREWGGNPWESKTKALLEKYNPVNFIEKWTTPQLLIHSGQDYRVPDLNSISVFHILQQLNIPTRLVIFPDETHVIVKPGNLLKWQHETFRWYDKFVGEVSENPI